MTQQPEGPAPPAPVPSPLTQFYWDAASRRELWIQRCQSCGRYIHFPRPVCRFCRSQHLTGEAVSGMGTLYSWTIAMQPFHPFYVDRIPYNIATVELVEQCGLMVLTRIVNCAEEELRAEMPLEVTFEDVTPELKLPVFQPASS